MTRSVRLRPWQKRALDRLGETAGPDFLAVATPGAGKTTFALTAARLELARRRLRRVVVVAPTQHLKAQWADAAERFDLHLEPFWSPAEGLPADVHGVVVTYQQVAQSAPALRPLASGAFVVFDEIHHAGDERAWGDGVRLAFEGAARRLGLSGTPFRSDTRAIPFVSYRLDEARPDFEYGYGDALVEGRVVRPVYFPRLNGEMEWSAPDGSLYRATFDDALNRQLANQRLRTALSLEGEWLPAVLGQAAAQLQRIRRQHQPNAGGLVIAMDQDHARGIARLLEQRLRARAVVATSDDPAASDRIARYARSDIPWIVAVRMVSEGVDIPRLRVGVFATNTTTELFFRQAVGRLVRWQRGLGRQPAYLFIPNDVRLRTFAYQLADQRRHTLRTRREDAGGEEPQADPTALDQAGEAEQLSLFAALSATPLGMPAMIGVGDEAGEDGDDDAPGKAAAVGLAGTGDEGGVDADDGNEVVLTLLPAPSLAGTAPGVGGAPPATRTDSPGGRDPASGEPAASPREERRRLRDLNSVLAAQLAHATGLPHAKVHAELNRLVGVRRVTEATNAELQARLAAGRAWFDRLRRR
jgi:superfamily II DNA or RNA helicase